jgi:hypothetical protein
MLRRLKSMTTYPAVEVPQDIKEALVTRFQVEIREYQSVGSKHMLNLTPPNGMMRMWFYIPKRWPDYYHLGLSGDTGWSVHKDNVIDGVAGVLTMCRLGIHPELTKRT